MLMQACWIWGWFAELAALAVIILCRMGASKAKELRRVLHEEKYLVGRQLNNLVRAQSSTPASADQPAVAAGPTWDQHAEGHE